MTWFPQLGAGSVTQFPMRRSGSWRSISNSLESGERIVLPDAASGQIEWRLTYRDLSDAELKAVTDLFNASSGKFGAFGFIDPMANLLGFSEDVSQPDWQTGLLGTSTGQVDPWGGTSASALSNHAPAEQELAQTLVLPGDYVACFSAWLRADGGGSVSIRRDGTRSVVAIGSSWRRASLSVKGVTGSQNSTFAVVLPPGETVQVCGLQVEAQPYASKYRPSLAARGTYEETYFGDDELTVTATGPGLSSCDLTLLSRV